MHFSNPLIGPNLVCFQSSRIGADESIDDTEGKTVEEVQEMTKEQEAKARAQILEMVRALRLAPHKEDFGL